MKPCINQFVYLQCRNPVKLYYNLITVRTLIAKSNEKKLQECYQLLNIPVDSKQDAVREAFLQLAKKYHPDSGSPEADMDKFVAVENAFRVLTKHNTGASNNKEIEKIVYDIRHTAPQHRQYLSYEGIGHGTPSQRQKQWAQAKAQRAANNVMEHRIAKAVASDNTLMKKGQQNYGKKHDIKTKYGFDRLVEDLIQESMSKGEFENLSGKGKPLKDQNRNPYVDFTTHKLNEVLINNGFTPEWITMSKEIDQDIEFLKRDIKNDRMVLGPFPLSEVDEPKWHRICDDYREFVKTLNSKINKYNLIVPLINRQKFYVEIDKILDDILKNGPHSMKPVEAENKVEYKTVIVESEDLFGILLKAFEDVFTIGKDKKSSQDKEKLRKEQS
ncbi:dnaJ homolog subfamily C member 28 [Ostrinia furnacalis]|uniref:dnaJ homolog subfamily C member 28 n=1 Tax=Ostrinia furnacalis TaxID=93504 RepID=UPI00103C331D|nr:dnaJ homolog subfamily C member 28 [Ostrinia furnacalis]